MLDRRNFLKSIAATSISTAIPDICQAQALIPVRLLVVRKPGFSLTNECVAPCIRSKIYDVSAAGDLQLDGVIVSLLGAAVCDALERPWKSNQPSVSSVPKGICQASIRNDMTKPWMDTENKKWRLELSDVPHRSNIQFHYGKDIGWSEGCFIVGDLLQPDGSVGMESSYCQVDNGEAAVARLRSIVEAPGNNPSSIVIGITDDYGLFPDFANNPTCGAA